MFDSLETLKTKLYQKQFAERMRKHMATAVGPSLHTGAIALAMAVLDDDLLQEELTRVRPDQRAAFMMTYECIVTWAILRGMDLAGMPQPAQTGVLNAMKDHFARHAFYVPHQFEKLWDQTKTWMPGFAKPTKDGSLWPAAAFGQIATDAGSRLDYIPSMAFGYYVINTIISMIDIGKFAAQQELQQQAPRPGSVLEAALKAAVPLIVSGYRSIAAAHGCAPSTMTSDEKIIEVYSRVCRAFGDAFERRGEVIPAVFLNRIVLYFLQFHQDFPEHVFDEHLRYEVEKYVAHGLRPEYQKELRLF